MQKPATSAYAAVGFSVFGKTVFGKTVAAPGVIRVHDLVDIDIGQFTVNAVDEGAEFTGVDEQCFAFAFATF